MEPYIFIGDIAGQFEPLMDLVSKCPVDRKILCLGDLCDRGPQSKEVIEWVKSNPRADSLYGNHEDMFIDWYRGTRIYEKNLWVDYNGGDATLRSYRPIPRAVFEVPFLDHITWLENRPKVMYGEGWVATHAPIGGHVTEHAVFLDIHRRDQFGYIQEDSVIWNRMPPVRSDKYQIYGHNGKIQLHKDAEGEFACCIDTSHQKALTAFLWPEKTFIQVPLERSPVREEPRA
jgi:serine/threonine protein phosphatase 1